MKPPPKWGKLPEIFLEWKQATDGHRERRHTKYIDDLVRLKEADIQTQGEGIHKEFFWRQHVPDLFGVTARK